MVVAVVDVAAAGELLLVVPVRDMHMIVWLQLQGGRFGVDCSRIVVPFTLGHSIGMQRCCQHFRLECLIAFVHESGFPIVHNTIQ